MTSVPPAGTVAAGREESADPRRMSAVLSRAAATLARAGVPSPQADAELLLAHLTGLDRGRLLARAVAGGVLDAEQLLAADELVSRRAAREPLQHITGRAPFRHLELAVGPGVFVPRPETEFTAQLAIDLLLAVPGPEPRAVDLGTGSGAIALAIATEVPHARVVGVENSVGAFVWAKQNAREIAASNLRLVFADLALALPEWEGAVDVLVSNPPYVPEGAIPRDPEVQRHDPASALYGGADGLDVVRALSRRGRQLVRPGGSLVLEHGEEQGAAIRALLEADDWRATATHRDLLGRDRVTTALR